MSIQLHLGKAWAHLAYAKREARRSNLEPSVLTQRIDEAINAAELATAEWRKIQRAQDEALEAAMAEWVEA